MTYEDYEQSVNDSQPIELYEFTMEGNSYRYTSANIDVTWNGFTWVRDYLQRSTIEQTGEKLKNEIEIKCFRSNDFINQFVVASPESPVLFTLYRLQGDTYVTYWIGTVLSVNFSSDEVVVKISPPYRGGRMSGLRRKFQKQCTYPLYQFQCKASKGSFQLNGTVDGISGKIITVNAALAKANGWFKAGKFKSGVTERLITGHTGSQLTLSQAVNKVSVGASCSLWAGCPHTWGACDSKFNNRINFGGQPWIPTRNPFGNDGVS